MTLAEWLATQPGRCADCGHHVETQGCRCVGSEWDTFVTALHRVADVDGTVHQGKVRPIIRGRIAPKRIGQMYRRARAEGLITDTGEREPSNDARGRNTDKLDRIYRLTGERGVAA